MRKLSFIIIITILISLITKPTIVAAKEVSTPAIPASEYLVGSFYFPAWRIDLAYDYVDSGWFSIKDYPDRKPLLGYFNEGDPEATDWEIKWATEHGINFFIFLWDRCPLSGINNCTTVLGKPIEKSKTPMHYALDDGFLNASLKDKMKFSIMTNINVNSIDDLNNNFMPYLINNYFKLPNYLVIDNKPVLYIGDPYNTANANGDIEIIKTYISAIRQSVKNNGFDDIILLSNTWQYVNKTTYDSQKYKEYGIDYIYSYVTPPVSVNGQPVSSTPTEQESINSQTESYNYLLNNSPIPYVLTASPFWDSYPYYFNTTGNWYISPNGYKTLLNNAKQVMSQSNAELSKKMIIVDAWNEYGEGHYIAPTTKFGFEYLKSIRETLTNKDNLPDYRLPSEFDMGPYDSIYQNYVSNYVKKYDEVSKNTYTFTTSNDMIDVVDLGFNILETNKLTFGGWIKPSLTRDQNVYFSKPFTARVVIGKNGDGSCQIGTQNNNWKTEGSTITWPVGKITNNTWHQIICVYDGAKLSIFIDGVKINSTTSKLSGNLTNRLFNLRLSYNPPVWSASSISNFIFKNESMPDSKILQLYQTTKPEQPPTCYGLTTVTINNCNKDDWFSSPQSLNCITKSDKVNINLNTIDPSITEVQIANIPYENKCSETSDVLFSAPVSTNSNTYQWIINSVSGNKQVCLKLTNKYGSSKCGGLIKLISDTSISTGDYNNDGYVNVLDIEKVILEFGTQYTIFDYNNVISNLK